MRNVPACQDGDSCYTDAMTTTPDRSSPSSRPHYTYRLQFTGDANEYFRIWLANTLFSFATLGLYVPWARVRERKYFYGHTILDGQHFEYTARPASLLKPYLIIYAFYLLFSLVQYFSDGSSGGVADLLTLVMLLLFAAIYPLLAWLSMKFLARNTVCRNIPFSFSGSLGDAYIPYGLANVANVLTGFLSFPWALHMQRAYQINNLHYGQLRGRYKGKVIELYVQCAFVLFGGLGVMFVIGLLPIILLTPLMRGSSDGVGISYLLTLLMGFWTILVTYIVGSAILAYIRAVNFKYTLSHSSFRSPQGHTVKIQATFDPMRVMRISLVNSVVQTLTYGLMTPWAAIRLQKYILSSIFIYSDISLDEFYSSPLAQESGFGEAASEIFDINVGF